MIGDLSEVHNLVQQGADVNESTNMSDWGPLHIAAAHGRKEVVRYFVEQGADKETTARPLS